ncbi:TPA: restriction endonuclease subunit S [Vibrio vulnificus]
MSDLPKGWVETNFEDVSDYIQRGKGPKYTEHSDYPVVNQKAVRWFGLQEEYLKYVHPEQWEKWDEQRYIRLGDILWNSTGTGTIGRACHIDEIQLAKAKVVDSHVTIVRTNELVDSKFAFYWIKHPEIQNNINGLYNGSTNQVELSKKIVQSTRFPLAPLAEQKRIVEKLDEVLAQVDTIKARLDGIPDLLKRFRQSVLASAVSGKLTEEWRGDSEASIDDRAEESVQFHEDYAFVVPTSWTLTAIGNLSKFQQGLQIAKSSRRSEPSADVLPILRTVNYDNQFSNDVHYAVVDEKSIIAQPEDIVLSRTGTVGRVLTGYKGVMHNNTFRLNYNRMLLIREYLMYFLTSPYCQTYVVENSGRSTQPDLTHKAFSRCPISVPDVSEQKEIVRLVDQYFAFADTIEAQVKKAQARVDNLTQSILAKAFRGELVEQDPNDEPADKLLERIAKARAEADALAKAAKKAESAKKRAAKKATQG